MTNSRIRCTRMPTLAELAQAIDAASNASDSKRLRELAAICDRQTAVVTGQDKVLLHYYHSNTYAALIATKRRDSEYLWSWKQPDGIQNILLLRKAIAHPAFDELDPIIACQIRTNLANRLNNLGRPIAAIEQWTTVLSIIPTFAKALANQANAFVFYAKSLYDHGHAAVLLSSARSKFDTALSSEAFWESGDAHAVVPELIDERDRVVDYLSKISYDEDYDLNQWSLGSTKSERAYRKWCLDERLFLNPLNDICAKSVAATDSVHLPNHAYNLDEVPRFPAYFNLMKQEYISARYRLYRGKFARDPEFVMRDVLMLDSGEGQSLGHYTEEIRSAFKSSYAIFDKIGLFLNDYFRIGLPARNVTFRRVWSKGDSRKNGTIRLIFQGRQNWALRGLYFLSKDLFDHNFKEVAEPDAQDLSDLRQQIEHRFLSFQEYAINDSTDLHKFSPLSEFENKALRLLKMAREGLIYLSLAMHREEMVRDEGTDGGSKLNLPVSSRPMGWFHRN